MKYGIYSFYRFLFGAYLIWLGIYNLNKLEANSKLVITSFEGYSVLGSQLKEYASEKLDHYLNYKLPNISLNLEDLLNSSNEFVFIMNYALIMGGLLTALGYKVGFSFVFIGLFLNIFLIHNIFYFVNEKMKVNVLKMLAILGGAFQLV